MEQRPTRRIIGWLGSGLARMGWHHVTDPRKLSRCCWKLSTVLSTVVLGLVTGCHSVSELEELTASMSGAARRWLGLRGRLPDTTLRRVLVALVPSELRAVIHAQIRAFHRQKALEPENLRFGVVSMDGKMTSIRSWDGVYAQQQGHRGVVRTITASLISSPGRPCIDAYPIPASTNEMGSYLDALRELVTAYGRINLFRVVMYDAGACSEANARGTREMGLHYVMQLTEGQPTLLAEAKRVLPDTKSHIIEDGPKGQRVRYTLKITEDLAGFLNWSHLKTVLHVHREQLNPDGTITAGGNRYFVSSLSSVAFTAPGWAALIRARWGVENNCHHTFDTAFEEDDRTWFTADPVGALNIILLRRLAYNAMALLRARTLKGETTRMMAWKQLIRWLYNALIAATEEVVNGLRARAPPKA